MVLASVAGRLALQEQLKSSQSQWVAHVVEPIHNLCLCHWGHFFPGPIGQWLGWLRKESVCLKTTSSYLLDYWTPLLKSIYKGHKYLHILCPFEEIYLHNTSLNVLLINFPVTLFPNPEPYNQCTSYRQWISKHLTMIIPPFKYTRPCVLCKILPTVKLSIHRCLSMLSQKWITMLSCSLLGGTCIPFITVCKAGPSLLFLSELIIRLTLWSYRCILESRQDCK